MSSVAFEGKVALVWGGTRGIGRAVAVRLLEEGASVVISGRDKDTGRTAVREMESHGRVLFAAADVSQHDEVCSVIDHAVSTLGGLDYACNAAGIEGEIAPLADQDERSFERVLGVNALGVLNCVQQEIRAMLKRGGGAIVNVASIAASKGVPGAAPYVASKHAVLGLTRTAALEYASSNIRINAVCPALVHTAMAERLAAKVGIPVSELGQRNPMQRVTRSEEVAEAIVWLLSAASSSITGAALAIDGGASVA